MITGALADASTIGVEIPLRAGLAFSVADTDIAELSRAAEAFAVLEDLLRVAGGTVVGGQRTGQTSVITGVTSGVQGVGVVGVITSGAVLDTLALEVVGVTGAGDTLGEGGTSAGLAVRIARKAFSGGEVAVETVRAGLDTVRVVTEVTQGAGETETVGGAEAGVTVGAAGFADFAVVGIEPGVRGTVGDAKLGGPVEVKFSRTVVLEGGHVHETHVDGGVGSPVQNGHVVVEDGLAENERVNEFRFDVVADLVGGVEGDEGSDEEDAGSVGGVGVVGEGEFEVFGSDMEVEGGEFFEIGAVTNDEFQVDAFAVDAELREPVIEQHVVKIERDAQEFEVRVHIDLGVLSVVHEVLDGDSSEGSDSPGRGVDDGEVEQVSVCGEASIVDVTGEEDGVSSLANGVEEEGDGVLVEVIESLDERFGVGGADTESEASGEGGDGVGDDVGVFDVGVLEVDAIGRVGIVVELA